MPFNRKLMMKRLEEIRGDLDFIESKTHDLQIDINIIRRSLEYSDVKWIAKTVIVFWQTGIMTCVYIVIKWSIMMNNLEKQLWYAYEKLYKQQRVIRDLKHRLDREGM